MQLKDAKPGTVVNFTYKQPVSGPDKRYLAKVLSAKTLTKEEIDSLYARSDYRRHDGDFSRSETLVTCRLPGGQTRNFYAERTEDCVAPSLGRVMFLLKDAVGRILQW